MITTIGSLVQETFARWRWLGATLLYALATVSTSLVLGATLGSLGQVLRVAMCAVGRCPSLPEGRLLAAIAIGLLAVTYALGDIGLLHMPRPRIRSAVPVTWWRRWRPYGAALAYGAALDLGVMTVIPFGAFYVLCAWCVLNGNIPYAAALMGTYGAARALVLAPISWHVYSDADRSQNRVRELMFGLPSARLVVAVALMVFGAQIAMSVVL